MKQTRYEYQPLFKTKGGHGLNQFTEILIERLEKKGMEPNIIPGFVRNLANTILADPYTHFLQVNKQLHLLGWDDFELDYRTLELARASLEAEGLTIFENKRAPRLEINIKPRDVSVN